MEMWPSEGVAEILLYISEDWHLLLRTTVLGTPLPLSLRAQSQQTCPVFCTMTLWGCYCSEFLFKPLLITSRLETSFLSRQCPLSSVWRQVAEGCLWALSCTTGKAGVLECLQLPTACLGDILQIHVWGKSILWATELIPLLHFTFRHLHLNFHLRLKYKMKEFSLSLLMREKKRWLMRV